MGGKYSTEKRRFYVQGDRSGNQTFFVKVDPDATVQNLLVVVQDYLRQKRTTSLGLEAQFFRINKYLVEPHIKISTLTNSKQNPLQFCDRGKKLWVQVSSADPVRQSATLSFAIGLDTIDFVAEAIVAIESIQQKTRNFETYGNGVLHIINSVTGEPAPRSEYICNLYDSNKQDEPLLFVEAASPKEAETRFAKVIIAAFQRTRTGTTSSERPANNRTEDVAFMAGLEAQVGGI